MGLLVSCFDYGLPNVADVIPVRMAIQVLAPEILNPTWLRIARLPHQKHWRIALRCLRPDDSSSLQIGGNLIYFKLITKRNAELLCEGWRLGRIYWVYNMFIMVDPSEVESIL